MSVLTQPINIFIDEQVKTGIVSSVIEAEEMILSAVSERALERELSSAQDQVKNGLFYEANNDFINNLLFDARSRITSAN